MKIIGDGPLAESVKAAVNQKAGIDWLGRRQPQEVLALLGEAACLVMPSIWYETFGRTIIEAYAKGTPVVASRLGAMAELVDDGRTGVLFEPGNAADLARKVHSLFRKGGLRWISILSFAIPLSFEIWNLDLYYSIHVGAILLLRLLSS